MANTKVTGDLIASGTITAANLVSGTLDTLLNSYLTTNTYATQGYVTTAVNNLIDAAPASLDTLNELAAALNDDANFATTVTNSLATKLNLSGGTMTGALSVNGIIASNSSSTGDYVRLYGGSGSAQWDIYGNGENLRFSENSGGGGSVVIDSSVGIGTTSPNAPLHVYGKNQTNGTAEFTPNIAKGGYASYVHYGTSGDWYIRSANASGKIILQDTGGNVGIGDTSPSAKLDVAKSDNAIIRVRQTSSSASGRYSQVVLTHGSTFFGANDKTYQLVSNGQADGEANFAVQYWNGSTYQERMRITSAGILQLGSDVAPVLSSNFFISRGDQYGFHIHTQTGFTRLVGSDDYLYLGTGADTSTVTINGGKVGIGNTSPGEKLDVVGQIKTSGSSTHALRVVDGGGGYAQIYATGGYYGMRLDTVTSSSNYYLMSLNSSVSNCFYVQADGKVGFGTGTPTARIDSTGGGYKLQGGWGLFSSYTSDGLFSSNSQANFLSTNGYNGTYSKFSGNGGLLLGYQDNGAGLYSPAYGFEVKSTDGRPVGGQVVKAIVMHDIDTDEQPFWVNNNGSAYFKNTILIGSTSNAGSSARLSVFNGDTQEGLAVKMSGTSPYSPIAVRNQNNDYMFQVSQTGEVRINDAGIGINETLRIKGVETAFRTYGSQSGYTQGAIVISSGTDSVPGARGQGVFYFNEGNDITWYSGGLYQSADRFDICRKSSTSSIDTSTAQPTYSLFHLNNAGSAYNATGTWGTISSDQRLKENIVDATPKLNDVLSLQVRNFNYIGQNEKYIGFIAQELEEVFPSLVTINDNREYDREGNVLSGFEDTKGVKVGMDFAILVKAIQEQQEIINNLKAEVEALKQQLNG